MKKGLIIAIDGPSGVGKSTIAKLVAAELKYQYIDTGAIYRAITWKTLEKNLNLKNEESILRMIKTTDIKFQQEIENNQMEYKILIDNLDVSHKIRGPKIDKNVSIIAKMPKIRAELISLQRNLAKKGKIVMEGRDIGSTILDNADLKFYFIASEKERTYRRYLELKRKGYEISYDEVKAQLLKRDEIDSQRKVSPLKKAKDAIVINSSNKNIDEVKKILLAVINKYQKQKK